MKRIQLCLLLVLCALSVQAQKIDLGLRLQSQVGLGQAYDLSGKLANGFQVEFNSALHLSDRIAFETGIGYSRQNFRARLVFDQDDSAADGAIKKKSDVVMIPARFLLRTPVSPSMDLVVGLGYLHGRILKDRRDIQWDSPPDEWQKNWEPFRAKSQHGFEFSLDLNVKTGSGDKLGFGLSYQNIRRSSALQKYRMAEIHLFGVSLRYARAVRKGKH